MIFQSVPQVERRQERAQGRGRLPRRGTRGRRPILISGRTQW